MDVDSILTIKIEDNLPMSGTEREMFYRNERVLVNGIVLPVIDPAVHLAQTMPELELPELAATAKFSVSFDEYVKLVTSSLTR